MTLLYGFCDLLSIIYTGLYSSVGTPFLHFLIHHLHLWIRFCMLLCMCAFPLCLRPPQDMALRSLLSSIRPLPRLIIRKMQAIPCAGDRKVFQLFKIMVFLARRPVLVTLPTLQNVQLSWKYKECCPTLLSMHFCFSFCASFHAHGWFIQL